MIPKIYVENALRTEAPVTQELMHRLVQNVRLMHAAMGLCTEVGEFQDMLKKHIFYNKPLDKVNLAEEIGDMLWYIAIASDVLDIDLEDIMITNIAKLRARYPERFSEDKAQVRDLDKERTILEQRKSQDANCRY